MNGQLKLKLIQCNVLTAVQASSPPEAQRAPDAPKQPEEPILRLLGHGLDAIIQHTRPRRLGDKPFRTPAAPSDQQRMDRYKIAEALHPVFRDPVLAQMRVYIGEQRRKAWQLGKYARFAVALLYPRSRRQGAKAC